MSASELVQAKAALRAEIRNTLNGISPEHRAQASLQACERLQTLEVWRAASRLLCYAPRRDELDICPLIEDALAQGKIVALPRFDPLKGVYHARRILEPVAQFAPGHLGIREPGEHCPPIPVNQLDLILAPGVAFDLGGRRLGRGRGFYDRLLENVRGTKCGMGFEEQIRTSIPVESHDILLDCLLTPARWCDFRPREAQV